MKTSKILLLLTIIVVIFSGCDLLLSDANAVESDKNNLTIGYSVPDNADHVTKNLKLDTKGVNGSSIGWQSSNPNVIDIHGAVTRPTDTDSLVTLTATISKGSALATKAFIITVKASSQVTYQIGDPGPAGGLIFYIDEDDDFDWTYLEAAPAGWYGAEDPEFVWGGYGVAVETNEEIGTGKANTANIFATYGENEPYEGKTDYAAKICSNLTFGGYDDWFLPSHDELIEMYQVLHLEGKGEFFDSSETYYWSSSQTAVTEGAWTQRFDLDQQMSRSKDSEEKVRPIRSF